MSRKIYLGRLNDQVRERDVERFFKGFRIRSVMLKSGYGFVEFDDAIDADDAVYDMNGKELCGDRIIVEHARGPSRRGGPGGPGGSGGGYGGSSRSGDTKPIWLDKYGPPVRTPYRVRVENLSSRVSWQDLKDYLRQAGEVTYADAHKENKNQGIVEFASYRDMKNVITKLDDTEINGRHIRIIEVKSSKSQRHSRSHSRSRSRSRERSASYEGRNSRNSRSRSTSPKSGESRSRSRSRSHEERDRRDSVRNEQDRRSSASD